MMIHYRFVVQRGALASVAFACVINVAGTILAIVVNWKSLSLLEKNLPHVRADIVRLTEEAALAIVAAGAKRTAMSDPNAPVRGQVPPKDK